MTKADYRASDRASGRTKKRRKRNANDAGWSVEERKKRRDFGQNFLRSRKTAKRFVDSSGVCGKDLIVEFGAGSGMLTRSLSRRAGRIIAIERDERWADLLKREFSTNKKVEVMRGDALKVKLPEKSFRVVANIPFNRSTDILVRLLDDPETPLRDVHLLVQDSFAKKHTDKSRMTLKTLCWSPWWEFSAGPKFPAHLFDPIPNTDARVLVATKRDEPLVRPELRGVFRAFIREAFDGRGNTTGRVLRRFFTKTQISRLARDNGFATGDFPSSLDVHQWARLFDFMLSARPKNRWPRAAKQKIR